MQATVFRQPLFWVLATILSLGTGYAAYRLFPLTFPLVSIDLTMDRSAALTQATSIAKHLSIGPQEYSQAIKFASDNKAKTYIELEGGGTEKFKEVLKGDYFAPYHWHIRHFKPCVKHEATIYFTPNGTPYGFEELIPENELLPSLDKAQAQQIAEKEASTHWHIDFSKHTLVEHSTDEKPNGRMDHMLEYERTDQKIHEAPFRVSITVTGNKVTKVEKTLKVPEAFERRYAHMRSANNLIASWARTAVYILYLLLGCILGLILLLRSNRDWLIWKAPLCWAALLAIGLLLTYINSYPLWWINYNTTDSVFSFVAGIIQALVLGIGEQFAVLYITFLAAENLTRKAFPKHIQLWSLAKTDVASSWQVLGRTIGSYMMISFDFIFVTVFYFISLHYFGWWSPADALIDPNVLATYVPWFTPFINSLHAGFWEECLFRAVPLSCAMLLARRYGNKFWWLTGGMIVQALIFAGSHAFYPAQPAYARLVELIIPSFVFGGLYLAFGLLPAILSHVTYDLVLYALPIFVSDAPGNIINKIMVIACGLIPLFVVLYARAKKGFFHDLSGHWYNRSWIAPLREQKTVHVEEYIEPKQPGAYRNVILIAGLLGLNFWAFFRPTTQDTHPLDFNRAQAIEKAHEAQKLFNLTIAPEMSLLSATEGKQSKKNIFVWRTAGKEIYKQLDGTYLLAPHWNVRYAQFNGDIAQSAEEYVFALYPQDEPVEYEHKLPREGEGASLTKEEARNMTQAFLDTYYQLKPEDVVEVSAQETQQPHRRDWKFVYRVKQGPDLGEGQLRIEVKIGGNQIIEHERYVHVPEQWDREYEYETKIEKLIKNTSIILLIALLIFLFFVIIRRRQTHPFATKSAIIIGLILLSKTMIQTWNLWPILVSSFNTTSPYSRQVITLFTTLLTQTAILTLFLAWLGGYVIGSLHGRSNKSQRTTVIQGLCLGFFAAGISAFSNQILPATKPLWADVSNAGAYVPWLSMGLIGFTTMLMTSLLSLLFVHGLNMLSDYGRKNHVALVATLLFIGIAIAGIDPSSTPLLCVISGILSGLIMLLLYYLLLRFNYSVIPVFIATQISIAAIQSALLQAFPGVWTGAALTVLLAALTAYWFLQQLKPAQNPLTSSGRSDKEIL